MGTKLQPGAFDCYTNALPDEPMFILLARDPDAPTLVDIWADWRELHINHARRPEGDRAMTDEARQCANSMRAWRAANDGTWRRPVSPSTETPSGWRPIDTAPKDGTPIDVWVGGEFPHRVTDVAWRAPTDSEWWTHGGDTIDTPEPTWHDQFGPLGKLEQPTHWMPAPAPPAQTETA